MKIRKIFSFDLRSLACFRISLGLLVLYDLAARARDLKAFYTDDGVLPRTLYFQTLESSFRISLYFLNGSLAFAVFLFVLTAIAAAALAVGYKTRYAAFVSWFLLMSLQVRNPMVNTNADHLLRLFLMAGILLPLGDAFSIDSSKATAVSRGPIPAATGFQWPNLFYFFLFSFIYWFSAFFKIQNAQWHQGMALLGVFKNINAATPIAVYLSYFPQVLKILNYAVILFESLAPFLLFIPLARVRLFAILFFIVLHAVFGFCLFLGFFPWVSMAALIPFIPSESWVDGRKKDTLVKHPENRPAPFWVSAISLYLLVHIFIWNFLSLAPQPWGKNPLIQFGRLFYIDQTWSVFVPPGEYSIWYEMPARLRDGTTVDLSLFPRPGVEWKDFYRRILNEDFRWERYLTKIWPNRFQNHYPYLVRYLEEEWNRTHRGDKQVEKMEVYGCFQYFYPELSASKKTRFI